MVQDGEVVKALTPVLYGTHLCLRLLESNTSPSASSCPPLTWRWRDRLDLESGTLQACCLSWRSRTMKRKKSSWRKRSTGPCRRGWPAPTGKCAALPTRTLRRPVAKPSARTTPSCRSTVSVCPCGLHAQGTPAGHLLRTHTPRWVLLLRAFASQGMCRQHGRGAG